MHPERQSERQSASRAVHQIQLSAIVTAGNGLDYSVGILHTHTFLIYLLVTVEKFHWKTAACLFPIEGKMCASLHHTHDIDVITFHAYHHAL